MKSDPVGNSKRFFIPKPIREIDIPNDNVPQRGIEEILIRPMVEFNSRTKIIKGLPIDKLISTAEKVFDEAGLGKLKKDNTSSKLNRLFTLVGRYDFKKKERYFKAFNEIIDETGEDFKLEIDTSRKKVVLYLPLSF